jgi:hypothetical protein
VEEKDLRSRKILQRQMAARGMLRLAAAATGNKQQT